MTHPDIEKLWNFQKPDESEHRFRDAIDSLGPHAPVAIRLELETQIARTYGLRGEFDRAHALLDSVHSELTDDMGVARVRYLLERGRTFNSSRNVPPAREAFLEAWTLGRSIGADALAVDAAHMMAIVEPPEKKLRWNLDAMSLAEASDDPKAGRWLGSLYNNIGWDHFAEGRFAEALAAHEKGLAWQREHGSDYTTRIARWSVAKLLRHVDRVDEALVLLRELEAEHDALGEPDGFVYEELGECLLAQGHADEATPYFQKAYDLLQDETWISDSEPERLPRLKALAGR